MPSGSHPLALHPLPTPSPENLSESNNLRRPPESRSLPPPSELQKTRPYGKHQSQPPSSSSLPPERIPGLGPRVRLPVLNSFPFTSPLLISNVSTDTVPYSPFSMLSSKRSSQLLRTTRIRSTSCLPHLSRTKHRPKTGSRQQSPRMRVSYGGHSPGAT